MHVLAKSVPSDILKLEEVAFAFSYNYCESEQRYEVCVLHNKSVYSHTELHKKVHGVQVCRCGMLLGWRDVAAG